MTSVQAAGIPVEQRIRNLRLVAIVGIMGDAITALVFLLLRPIGTDVDYYIPIILVASGIYIFVMFYWFFPRRMKNRSSADTSGKV